MLNYDAVAQGLIRLTNWFGCHEIWDCCMAFIVGPIFEEVARIIRDGGIFGFMVFEQKPQCRDGWVSYKGDDISEKTDEESGVRMFRHSEEYISRLLRGNGFTVLRSHRFAGLMRPSSDEVIILRIFIAQKGKP